MKTIVIPDLHHKTDWIDPFLKTQEPYDEVVFVGDYFDDFHDGPIAAKKTADWLKKSLKDPKRKHCVGNHDLPYMIDVWNLVYDCPGFDADKDKAINKILKKSDWDKIVPAVYTQGWLISHAGFSKQVVEHPVTGIPTAEKLVEQAVEGLRQARNGNWHPLFVPGERMGSGFPGGITWSDWNNEFQSIPGIPQIVGHTPQRWIESRRVSKDQVDYNVDCFCKEVIIITNGVVSTVKTK